MSVRSDKTVTQVSASEAMANAIAEALPSDLSLHEGSNYSTTQAANPLSRNIMVTIRASLNDLVLQKGKATWAPSADALKSIFQQRKFTDLQGSAANKGDLSSVVLHSLDLTSVNSSFPISVGARITGVDDVTYSSTGEAFSTIVPPNSSSHTTKTLQKDDTALAYDFAAKFPGYTAANLAEKGVHEVQQRRFVLLACDHPVVSAISENAERLQMGEISMMPEGLVKISSGLYESILPLVKSQVESQIKVRDFSSAQVTLMPAEHSSWAEAKSALVMEAKRAPKARFQAELAAAADADKERVQMEFGKLEREIENKVEHEIRDFHAEISISYNFLDNQKE